MRRFLTKAFVTACLVALLVVVIPAKLLADLVLWFIDEVVAEKFVVWLQKLLLKVKPSKPE